MMAVAVRGALTTGMLLAIGCVAAAAGTAADKYCRGSGRSGYAVNSDHVVLRSSGEINATLESTFTVCEPAGERTITIDREPFARSFAGVLAITRSGRPEQLAAVDGPPDPSLNARQTRQYAVPAMDAGDMLMRSVRASWPAILGDRQLWIRDLPAGGDVLEHRIVVESERTDVAIRLTGPSGTVRPRVSTLRRSEWRLGCDASGHRLAIVTSASLERLVHEIRGARVPGLQHVHEIEALGIAPSSDAWWLFSQFSLRFPASPSGAQVGDAARGWDRRALAFLLLNLFRWNGIDAELVAFFTSADRNGRLSDLAVYVPALDRYFDPTRSPADQQRSSERSRPVATPRMHFQVARQVQGKPDPCNNRDGLVVITRSPDPSARAVKTIRVPGNDGPQAECAGLAAGAEPTQR